MSDERRGPIASVRIDTGQRYVDLGLGEHVIGRSPDSAISFDDPHLSRRHVAIVVTPSSITLLDLGSRNGVRVNGSPVSRSRELVRGDVITMGAQVLTVSRISQRGPSVSQASPLHAVSPALADAMKVTTTISHTSSGLDARLEAFRLIGEVAQRAIAAGDGARAEQVLERTLAEVLSTARGRLPIQPELVAFAARHALLLAKAVRRSYWTDYTFDLYGTLGWPMPREVVEELESVLPEVPPSDRATVTVYLSKARLCSTKTAEQELALRVEEAARRCLG